MGASDKGTDLDIEADKINELFNLVQVELN